MAKLITTAPRGTQDVLPQESYKWHFIEGKLMDLARRYGFSEVRTPTFEHTGLFDRGVGDTTDIVQKEMYTFTDKGGRSITLRPEGTAGVARCVLEHGLLNNPLPLKLSYLISCFRYEKPQAGRFREFRQFGAEVFGSQDSAVDAEVIALVADIFTTLGISDIALELNSIGCPHCRPAYHEKLRAYFAQHIDSLCPTCRERLEKNPLRILDCKNDSCKEVAKGAPLGIDNLCDECADHFASLKERLTAMGIPFTVNPQIVRGLDYYTKTVFEFVSTSIGAQGTVCGGGRYDGLLETLGGPSTPAIGFAVGLQRLLAVMEQDGASLGAPPACDIFLASIGQGASVEAQKLALRLRRAGLHAESDVQGRSLKAQMKYADKLGARYTVVLGDDEVKTGQIKLKRMDDGQVEETTLEALPALLCEK